MNLAVAAIFKDEARYLREWIEFHRLQGVEHFFLYDNDSSDRPGEVLWPYTATGVVTYKPWPGPVQQRAAYEDALSVARAWRWLAFVDIDEFLWSPWTFTPAPVARVLRSYEDFDAVAGHWAMFGPGGHLDPPSGLVLDSYLYRVAGADQHVKSIVRPAAAVEYLDPHTFAVRGETFYAPFETLRVNHYWTKSESEARAKFARGRADTSSKRQWSEYEGFVSQATHLDVKLAGRYGGPLGRLLGREPFRAA